MATVVNGRAGIWGQTPIAGGRGRAALTRLLDQLLDLLQRVLALLRPRFFLVGNQLDLLEARHTPRKVRKVEILARGTAERRLQDHFARVLAIDPVDELLRGFRVGPALDDRAPFHRGIGAL